MRRLLTVLVIATAVAAATSHVGDLQAAGGFAPGDLVVYRVGDGSAALTGNATAVFLDEYTPGGTLVQSIPLPIAPSGNNRALTASGTATSEGELTRSVDGQYLVAAGYNTAPGATGITTSSSATVNRVIARVDSNGSIDTTTALTDAISGGNPRGAVSTDGHDFWISGTSSSGGIRYAAFGATSSTTVSTTVTNLRHAGIFGGQLYVSSASGAFRLATVGTGLPMVSGQTIVQLPGIPTNLSSPYGFFFADLSPAIPGVDTVYIADDSASPTGGILKFSLSSNNMWVANGTVSSTLGLRSLTGTVTNGVVALFATGTSALATLTDSSGYNAANNGALNTLATAATNKAFRGVALAPVAGGPTGIGSAIPSSVLAGSPTLLRVTVTPAANPASTGLAVTADLSSIGGSATQPFFDDGTNGDAVAGDNIFSFGATVSGTSSAGAKSIAATITDEQSRTGSATIPLTVTVPASLAGLGAANPSTVPAGNITLLTVTVTPASSTASTGIAVNVDLSSIEGTAGQAFFDDGTHGDLVAGDNVFSFSATIPLDAASGPRTLSFTITDAQSRSASGGIGLTVNAVNGSTPPSGTGSAAPPSVPAGGTTQLTVNVTPGTNPASTGLTVTGDLSSIGDSNIQSFQSSGNTFSFPAPVDAATMQGPKMLGITVSDAQGRSIGFTIPVTVTAPLANSTIVISQIYSGGGNSGATYTNDFVQLYNRGSVAVDTTGWSLQYAPATGTGDWTGVQPLGGTIAPGQYYLIAMAAGGGAALPLPPANVTSLINMAQGAGKIALADSSDLLTGNSGCPTSTHVKALVGYGSTADCWEGTGPALVPGNLTATALFRQSGGAIDTNDNKSDFFVGPPAPLSTTPIVQLAPVVFSTYPTTNGVDIPRDASIEVTFTEAVTLDPAWFDMNCATTGPHDDATEAPDGNNRWITPNTNFVAGEVCTVTVFKAKVHDADTGILSPPSDYTWSFTVASGAAPPESADVHLLMGNPTNAAADINLPDNYLMLKPEYSLSYNRDLGRPNWVSWHLTDAWIPSNHPSRVDTFRPDPAVPPDWYRVQSFDFSSSGFDRGHMDPNADRESSLPVNQATFLMSNMVAQSPDNNQGPWVDFENYLRSVVHGDPAHLNEAYIVSGPVGTGGTGSNGGVTTTVAGGQVTVPSYTWKVALVLPDNGSEDDISRVTCSTTTIAVIMPNVQGIRTNLWQTYLTTVSAVEALTGYHFFTNLPQPIQNCIKAGTDGVNPKNDQTITFAPIADQPFGVDVTVQVTASSGLPVTLAVTSGPATINGTTLHFTGVGAVTIQATQAGDINYNAAPPVSQSFTVTPGSQTITFDGPAPTPSYGDPALVVSAAGGPSGNPVTLAASGACTGTSQPGLATITIVSAGVCTVTASQAGSADYNAAPQVSEAIVIGKATPSFTGLASPTIEAGTATTTLGGSIGLGVLIPTGAIAVTLNGVTQPAAIQANGSFASAFATGLLPPAATPYAVAYTYSGDSNFNGGGGGGALTVVDTTPPTITVPANITSTATTPAGATVTFGVSATDLVDGARPVSCAPASGSTFPIGTTTVTCSSSDTRGNGASRSFTVTVTTAVVPGTMTGDAAITSGSTTTTIQFAVLEGARGADAGFLIYNAKSRQSGRTQDNVFISALVTNVSFFNVPGVSPGRRPASGVDTVSFSGVGLWNGHSGYTFTATAVDAGEPGPGHDKFTITITDSTGHVVASLNATITSGNIQSLRAF